jgi:hypothetical protein
MNKTILSIATCIALSACATTDVQPLTASSFMISTTAAPACGPSGARKVANQAAAIEVIRRGGDRFVFVSQNSDSSISGVTFNPYAGVQLQRSNNQGLVVQMVSKGQQGYSNSLSAKEILGPDWQNIVEKGVPATCT